MADPTDRIEIAPGKPLPPSAVRWTFARGSGPGGQNVNKLNTKAVLHVDLAQVAALIGPTAANRLRRQASRYITDDEIAIAASEHRSQLDNRIAAIERLVRLIERAMTPPKRRRKTRPTRASKERRIKAKKETGEKKRGRRQRFD